MKILACAIPLIFFAAGCSAQSNPDGTDEAASELGRSSASTTDDPKWMIAIDGLPEKSGKIITGVTMEGYGNYALAGSKFTASIGLLKDEPGSSMTFTFSEENIRCVNKDGATAIRDDERAIIEGEVLCYPADGKFTDAKPAAIDGYFEVKR